MASKTAGTELDQTINHETIRLTELGCTCCVTTHEREEGLPDVPQSGANGAASKPDIRAPGSQHVFTVAGVECADCAASVERQVARLPGVRAAHVNFMTSRLVVDVEDGSATFDEAILQAVRDAGYAATPAAGAAAQPRVSWRRSSLLPTAIATVLWAIGFTVGLAGGPALLADALFAAAIATGGYRIARSGYYALVRGRTLGIDLLMSVSIIGAALIGEWAEGAAVVVLFSLGAALERLTMDRARNAIRSLMDLSPREANLKTAGGEQRVPVEQLVPGDVIVVRPGELVAADGRVVKGHTTINQASITGESIPVEKQVGDGVYAGTTNERGYVEVEVTKHTHDTTLAKIISMVEEAQATRAPSQRFVDQFSSYYTPAVIVIAALVAALPPLLGAPFLPWLYKALVLLVIACPCALVISTPVSIVAALGRASRSGVLIKGGAYLEAIGGVRAVAFDKTGTLTEGKPVVTDVLPLAGKSAHEILALAAAVESRSEHPLAGAILHAAREQGLRWPEPHGFEALTGRGVRAMVGDEVVMVGSPDPGEGAHEIATEVATLQQAGKTVLLVSQGDRPAGLIAVADQLRPGVEHVMARLRKAGIRSLVMLTGDNARTAEAVARRLGIDETRAGLLPEHKTEAIRELLHEHGQVAMVGDGVNDAPALASATVGIAMGAAGSDTALETADIALMGDDLAKLPYVIRLSRAALRTIRANIAFSLAVKAIFLLLTLVGVTNLWLAILADTGAALVVIANGMRLLRFREPETPV